MKRKHQGIPKENVENTILNELMKMIQTDKML